MIALINLLNVNRVQNQRNFNLEGCRNNEVPILSGVRLYSICGRKFDGFTDIKITQQRKSTLRACL